MISPKGIVWISFFSACLCGMPNYAIGAQLPRVRKPAQQTVRRRVPADYVPVLPSALNTFIDASRPLVAAFDWHMDERFGLDVNGNSRIDLPNTWDYVQNLGVGETLNSASDPTFWVTLDASPSRSTSGSIQSYTWQIDGGRSHSSDSTLFRTRLAEGTHHVTLIVDTGSQKDTVQRDLAIEDVLVVSIGDSYSAGEGNPECRRGQVCRTPLYGSANGPNWADDGTPSGGTNIAQDHVRSHRSTVGWPAQVALAIEKADRHTSVTFVSFAASGASFPEGFLGPYHGVNNEPLSQQLAPMPAQVAAVRQIVGRRRIDVLLMTAGVNDVGFSDVIAGLVKTDPVTSPLHHTDEVSAVEHSFYTGSWPPDSNGQPVQSLGANGLDRAYDQLADSLNRLNIFNTYIVEYPDPTGYFDNGQVYWCPEIVGDVVNHLEIDQSEEEFVTQFGHILDAHISNAANKHGWIAIPTEGAFYGHGYCAAPPIYNSPDAVPYYQGNPFPQDLPRPTDPQTAWFRTAAQASVLQGPLEPKYLFNPKDVGLVYLTRYYYTKGTMHPNELGHQATKDAVVGSLHLPVPIPGMGLSDRDNRVGVATETRRTPQGLLREVKRANNGQVLDLEFYETITPQTDVDMFKINVSRNERLNFRLKVVDTTGQALLRIFSPQGAVLGTMEYRFAGPVTSHPHVTGGAVTPLSSSEITVAEPGPIFVGVSGSQNRSYDPISGNGAENGKSAFSYVLEAVPIPGQPDNTLVSATVVHVGDRLDGFAIESAQDVDMFRFDASGTETITFSVTPSAGSTLHPWVRLFGATGIELSHAAGGLSYHVTSPGPIFIGVSAAEISGYDPAVGIAKTKWVAGHTGAGTVPVQASTGGYTVSLNQQ